MKASSGEERSDEMDSEECGNSCLFEVVVRIRRLLTTWGILSERVAVRLLMVLDASIEKESVDGRSRPGNEVRRMLIWAMFGERVNPQIVRKECVRLIISCVVISVWSCVM